MPNVQWTESNCWRNKQHVWYSHRRWQLFPGGTERCRTIKVTTWQKHPQANVQKLIQQLNRFGIFRHENPSIVCLDTRDVAPQHNSFDICRLYSGYETSETFSGEYLQLTQCQCKNWASARCRCCSKKLRCTAGCSNIDGTCRNPFNNSD